MPRYLHHCDACGNSHDDFRAMSDPSPTECPTCRAPEPAFHRVFEAPMAIVKGNPKTFGQQAELNAERLGKEQLQKRLEEWEKPRPFTGKLPEGVKPASVDRKEIPLPFYRSGELSGLPKMEKPLDLKKVKDVGKYIMTGEK